MGDPVPVAPSLEPVLNAVLAPREDEGPIIAIGGALGSVIGQLFHITADEGKTLLAGSGGSPSFHAPIRLG